MSTCIKIAIAEDFELERNGLIALLKNYDDFEVVLACCNGKELLEGLKNVTPDVILLDIEMSVMGGGETLDKIKIKYPHLRVIMLTEHFSDSYIIEFVEKGANSFLSKNNRIEKVAETIRKVHLYGSSFDAVVINILAGKGASDAPEKPLRERSDLNLTFREIEIIRLMCRGKENKDIMELLNIGLRTVESHRRNIWAKTNCNNVVELMDFAFKNNLISL